MGRLDGGEEVVRGVVDAGDELRVALGVGGPEDDDVVEAIGSLELADVAPDLLEVDSLVGTGEDVVGTLLLVRVDERGVVDRGERVEGRHVGSDLALEVEVHDLGSAHGLVERHGRDVPSSNLVVVAARQHQSRLQFPNWDRLTTRSLGWTMGRTSEKGT